MAFNAEQFRKDAADAGYSPEEIDAAIAKQSGNQPSATNMGPAANQGMMAEVMSRLPEGAQTFQEDAKNVMGIGLAAAGLGGAYTLYKAYQAHQDRALDREVKQLQVMEAKQRLGLIPPPAAPAAAVPPAAADFSLTGGQATPAQLAAFDQQFIAGTGQAPVTPPAEPSRMARAAAISADLEQRRAAAPAMEPLAPPVAATAPVAPVAAAEVLEAPKTAAAIATEQPGSAVADAVVRDELAKPIAPSATPVEPKTLRTGTGREVIAGEGQVGKNFKRSYPTPQAVPQGFAFLPGGQYIDVLRNDLGQQLYTSEMTKRPFPGGYPEAVELGKTINREAGRPTRAQLQEAGKPMPETTAGIAKKVGPGKIVQVGGVAGALVSLADLANARTTEERMNASLGLLGAVMPPGADVLPLQPGTLTPEIIAKQNAASLLGSPYAQTEFAKRERLGKKAGAGRGFVNPR